MHKAYRWARSRVLGGAVVLGYHRVVQKGPDPFRIALDTASFEGHVRWIARHAVPSRLTDAVTAVRSGRRTERVVVVTFDDGYADTVEHALPILEYYQVPATVFITTGRDGGEYWWDELTRLILEAPALPSRLPLRGTELSSGHDTAAGREKLLVEIASAFVPLAPRDLEAAMAEVRAVVDAPAGAPRHRSLRAAEIRQLAASALIEIGAHTQHHPVLPNLAADEQVRETVESRAVLERTTGLRVTSFSYPHGRLSLATREIVRAAGFEVACSSVPELITRRSDPLAVPRLWPDQRDERMFSQWMKWWVAN